MLRSGRRLAWLVPLALVLVGTAALAQNYGQPGPWQVNLQGAATPIAEQEHAFHNFLLVIITAISLFVLGLLIWVMVRFNENANPTPTRTTHNTLLEVAWTVVPVLILVAIAIPSFRLLFDQYEGGDAGVTLKLTGHQWYWSIEYPDQGPLAFDATMIAEKDLKPGQPRLLAVDNDIVVPIGKLVHVQVTAADVIHAFAIPSFGVKVDAVPGRLNDTWFTATRLGTYYGQCSELCGRDHAFMPIAIKVVSEADYAAWVAEAKQRFADGGADRRVAALGQN